ncbi:hypothetical protein AAC387_Pa07g0102 [Persea americana]
MSPGLYELRIFGNQLNETLPRDIGRNSQLLVVDVSDNEFSCEIPDSLYEKEVLEELLIIDNKFSRKISASLAQCRSLLRVRLKGNWLSNKFLGLGAHVFAQASLEFVLRGDLFGDCQHNEFVAAAHIR